MKDEHVWTVDSYVDRVCRRKRKLVEKDVRDSIRMNGQQFWSSHPRFAVFESEREACQFMVARAERLCRERKAEFEKAVDKLCRCEERLSGLP